MSNVTRTIRCTDELWERIRIQAEKEGNVSRSSIIRKAANEYIKKQKDGK